MLTCSIALEHAPHGVCVFGFQPGNTDTDMHVIIRASGINPVSRIARQNLTATAHAARATVCLCTSVTTDLTGTDFILRDDAFPGRWNLT